MFTEAMIAPCGLNCALCKNALTSERPCHGCNGDDGVKTDFCANRCGIKRCPKRAALPGGFCDQCPDYPCKDVIEKETRYASQYPVTESPMGNLYVIRREGMDAFLAREEKRWRCACGGVICAHTGVCSSCQAEYSDRERSARPRAEGER